MRIIILLSIIIIFLIIKIISIKKEIRSISDFIEKSHGEYINISIESSDKDIENLTNKINKLYDINEKINIQNKKVDEELKESIANMSHDLRTPLTSIMGYVELLKDDSILDEEKKEYLDIIHKRTKRLKKLISEFYDISRLETNEYKFDLEKLDLRALLSESIALYYKDFVENFIEPKIELKEVCLVISDKTAVMRIFSNLISNILKHGSGQVEITLRQDKDYVITEFVNYAPYLEEEDTEKIFQRFYTNDKSRTSDDTGLGLSITKKFVEDLGNEIEAKLINKNLHIIIRWKLPNIN